MKFAIYDTSKTDSSNHNGFQVTNCVVTNDIVEFYKSAGESGISSCMVEYIEDGSLRGPGGCQAGSYFLPSEEKITNKPMGASWTYDASTYKYTSPLGAEPTLTDAEKAANKHYVWDETAYQADNSTGWILTTKFN
tara:strand:+ start:98 stop:505 length:408 start_codon:yes stop_codon:yes gene_type:complete